MCILLKPEAEKTINQDIARVTHLVQNYRKVSDRNKADALKAITALKLQMDEELKQHALMLMLMRF